MNKAGGISFLGLLQVAFIVLKLCSVITWSWSIVLIPLWISLSITGLWLILMLLALILGAISG
jgi:hypothetical protein